MQRLLVGAFQVVIMSASVGNAVTVQGFADCAQWIQERQNPNQETVNFSHVYRSWLLGHLSGLSIARDLEFWDRPDRKISPDQVYLWMDNYCRANPLKDVSDGALDLFFEITGG